MAPAPDRRRAVETLATAARQQGVVAEFGLSSLARVMTDEVALMEQAVTEIGKTLDTRYVSYMEVSPDGTQCVMRAAFGWPSRLVGRLAIDLNDTSQARYTLRAPAPVVIDDFATETRFTPARWLVDRGVVSGMSVVVGVPGTPYGKLGAYSTSRRKFSQDDANFVQAMANVLAQAIRRTRNDRLLAVTVERLHAVATERQELIADLVHAQERERSRIAAEIHDDAVQVMAAVGMRLHTVRRKHGVESEPLDRLEEAVSVATGRLRRLLFQLRLPALDSYGLAAGIRTYLEQLKADTSITYTLADRLPAPPPVAVRAVIYRILQEALANVCKHARASHVTLTLSAGSEGVEVTLDDNGVGLSARTEHGSDAASQHLGITTMKERAAEVGGWCSVEPRHAGGTRVAFSVPMAPLPAI